MIRTIYRIKGHDPISTHRMAFDRQYIPAINRRWHPLLNRYFRRSRPPWFRRWVGALPVRPAHYSHILDD